MKLSFTDGQFVYCSDGLNYQEVLDDFENAAIIRIMTYNISAKDNHDLLFEHLERASKHAEIKLITNIPSRFPEYYASDAGMHMKNRARRNIEVYLKKLNPSDFDSSLQAYFNFTNHAKIIGTENIVYIGSANYSNESKYNIETGILITDSVFIKELYSEFFEKVIEASVPYFDDDFNVLRLLVLSLTVKFNIHKKRLLSDTYRLNQEEDKYEFLNDKTYLTDDSLTELVADLFDFEGLDVRAENTYSETNDEYNERIEEIVGQYESISVDWLINNSTTDSIMYDYVNFDSETRSQEIFEEEYSFEAYDEYLDSYMQKAMDDAADEMDDLLKQVNAIATPFLEEINKIISVLEQTLSLIEDYAESRISPEINNT